MSTPGRPNRARAVFSFSVWIVVLLMWQAPAGLALEPTTPLAEYGRQSWVMENGLPQNTVHALAQTSDGFLWLATEAGLARFDGYTFSVFDTSSTPSLPSSDIRCLLATRDGALWIGTSSGLARMKNGETTTFTTAKGLPGNQVQSLAEDARGFVIVTTDNGEASIQGEQITPLYLDMLESADGALNPVMSATQANGEHAHATTSNVTLMQGKKETSLSVGRELPGSRVQALFFDREGSLWIGTNGGLVRFARGKLDKLPVTDPLSNASILSLFEDREGNLWVGTETGGVHIFRDERFRNIGTREGLSSDNTTTVVEDSAGTLWVGTSGSGLDALARTGNTPGKITAYTVKNGLLSDVVLSLAAAPNGDIWVGTPDGLNLIRRGKVDSFTSADGLPDDFVRSLLVDTDGSLWIGTRRGLTHWMNAPSGKHMQTFTQASGLGSDLVGAMVRDRRGSLWVATLAGLSRLEGGNITNYTTGNGLSSDVVTALLPRSEGTLLIGTQDHGWNLWDGEKFSSPKDSRLNQTSIHAILDDTGNHLWFATGNGIARCDCTMTADCTHWVEFGPADGLRSRETAINSHPSAWRSRDGHLWFATPKGLLEADPAHFPINLNPAPVAVERFAVDDVDQPLHKTDLVRIPAGHGHFEFDYAGLSFTAPQKVRYRYMLEGFDHEWTNAGARRTAYYTNIPPGQYTFRVQAANNDGLWNLKGAALPFALRPHFYQTIWFYILLTAAVAGMVVVLLKRRLLRAEREFGAVLGERNRIAREIHDTLAQGYVGISVQLEVLSELLRHNKVDAAQKQLDATRGHVREGLADARQSIWALRSQDSGEKTLPVTLRRVTENSDGHGMESSFSVYGAYRPLPPGTEREFLRVAQEAIHNVKKHAGAKHLFVQMEYGPSEVALEIRDDGCGFAMDGNLGSAPGHYGMTGMRERAAAVGGRLEVSSVPGEGTTVRLRAPAPKEPKE